jgi:hypothetical protein
MPLREQRQRAGKIDFVGSFHRADEAAELAAIAQHGKVANIERGPLAGSQRGIDLGHGAGHAVIEIHGGRIVLGDEARLAKVVEQVGENRV